MAGVPLSLRATLPLPVAGDPASLVDLRGDKRQRPLVLRVRVGDCLTVNLTNLQTPAPNPNKNVPLTTAPGQLFTLQVDEQVASRVVGFHASGMQLVNSIDDDSSMVGRNHLAGGQGTPDGNTGSMVPQGGSRSYKLWAEKEGVFIVSSDGARSQERASAAGSSARSLDRPSISPKSRFSCKF